MRDLHADRARAESFGTLAEEYERLRPSPPGALIDELVEPQPERVLDIGCGTGKIALALMRRGLDVLGVELDERMAAIARRNGVEVELGAFEDWDDRGRTFDLITFGDSWHWIDPDRGWRKIARVLAPGGTVVRIWNHHEVEQPTRAALEDVYRRVAPDVEHVAPGDTSAKDDDPRVERLTYRWPATFTPDEYVALVATYSGTQALEPQQRAELLRELRAACGDEVRIEYRTVVSRSRATPR